MIGSTTQIDDETEDNEADDGEDLYGGEPELAFTEGGSTQKVDDDNNDTSDSDPYGIVGFTVPVYSRPKVLSVLGET